MRRLLRPIQVLAVLSACIVACATEGRPSSPGPHRPPANAAPTSSLLPAKMVDTDRAVAPAAATPSAASEPPYDRVADQRHRAKTAKEELGSKAMSTVVSDVFVVIGPPGWQGGQFEQSVALMKNAMAGFMNGRFGKKP
ncbi:MAG: glycogen branching enzyme, partial [Labilithrix sp.]|nr:glycogen branching enzyme [Labilithrix sp.]